jgi:hypothetical protein
MTRGGRKIPVVFPKKNRAVSGCKYTKTTYIRVDKKTGFFLLIL